MKLPLRNSKLMKFILLTNSKHKKWNQINFNFLVSLGTHLAYFLFSCLFCIWVQAIIELIINLRAFRYGGNYFFFFMLDLSIFFFFENFRKNKLLKMRSDIFTVLLAPSTHIIFIKLHDDELLPFISYFIIFSQTIYKIILK